MPYSIFRGESSLDFYKKHYEKTKFEQNGARKWSYRGFTARRGWRYDGTIKWRGVES
jgi:hypothetical protein